jgi:hypothetical protein
MTPGSNGRRGSGPALAARRRAGMVGGLRRLATGSPAGGAGAPPAASRTGESCDLCGTALEEDHRHMLHMEERRIECTCEACWALRSGDAEYRPVGTRVEWLPELAMSTERWAGFDIPIGLAFFMRSTAAGGVVALYPSPAGATESALDESVWEALVAENAVLESLESDAEGLVVNRLADPPSYAIAPIDDCYRLVGLVKAKWEGISGGDGLERAIRGYFEGLRERGEAG